MYCTNCGREIILSNKFCPSCGNALLLAVNAESAKRMPDTISVDMVKEHLKNASILEKRIYELNNLINNIGNQINNLRTLRTIRKNHVSIDMEDFWWVLIVFPIVWIIVSLILVFNNVENPILSLLLLYRDVFPYFGKAVLIAAIITAIPIVWFIMCDIVEAIKIEYNYKKNINMRDIEYAENLKKADILEEEKEDLVRKRQEAQKYLNMVYDKNILFPKYRNMIAVFTMLEYFVSGRCDRLTGHTGAYNIFESELRQNIIISSLEAIQNSLEQIKQNQYMVYQAIRDSQDRISDLSYEFSNISSSMRSIQNSAKVASYNAKIAADNTRLLAYFELAKY